MTSAADVTTTPKDAQSDTRMVSEKMLVQTTSLSRFANRVKSEGGREGRRQRRIQRLERRGRVPGHAPAILRASVALGAMADVMAAKKTTTAGRPSEALMCVPLDQTGPKPPASLTDQAKRLRGSDRKGEKGVRLQAQVGIEG